MKYKKLRIYNEDEIQKILTIGNKTMLRLLCMSIGENCDNWIYAQKVCVTLLNSEDSDIKCDAILGLSYIARTYRILDRQTIEPLLINEASRNIKNSNSIISYIDDIQIYLGWNTLVKFNKKYKILNYTPKFSTYKIYTKNVFSNFPDIIFNRADKLCENCVYLEIEKSIYYVLLKYLKQCLYIILL